MRIRRQNESTRYPRRRRGASYVFVLAIGLLLAVVCSSVLVVSRIASRGLKQSNDAREAEVLAENAVELALERLNGNPNWRTTYTSGVETSAVTIGAGAMSFKLVDESDGNLSNNNTDAVRLYGLGRIRNATKVYSVQLAVTKPLTCLWVAVHSGGAVTATLPDVQGSATISSNSSILTTGGDLHGTNLEAATTITNIATSGNGWRKTNITPRKLPDSAGVFDFYRTNGTSISISSIPTYLVINKLIKDRLFSPASNPFGGTNASGIYVIDCLGWPIIVSDCRVVGTLVLLNVGVASTIQDSQYWTPAVSNYPTLLVQGNIQFQMDGSELKDDSGVPINFNPAGTPYKGVADATYGTKYGCQINGLVYVSGNLSTSDKNEFIGVMVAGGTLSVGGELDLTYDATFYNNPPPGFVDTAIVAPVPGTWKWEAAP